MTDQPISRFRILSIDGGGYLGLATGAFLQACEHYFGTRTSNRFDLFCGTSTGAIFAMAFATGMSAEDAVKLYQDLGPRIFPPGNVITRNLRVARSIVQARHGNGALREALVEAFGTKTLHDVHASGKSALVTAFNLTSGRPRIFKTDHNDVLRTDSKRSLVDILLASTAAPTYLPPARLTDPVLNTVEQFADGGLVANSPALLGYAEAVFDLDRIPSTLDILSLSTPRIDHAERQSEGWHRLKDQVARGYLQWGFGPGILARVMDGGSMVSDSALQRIARSGGANYERVVLKQPAGLGLDVVTPAATQTLLQLGAECARQGEMLISMKPFFR